MEFVGRIFTKIKGTGVVRGYLTSYNESSRMYTVLYEDRNTEDVGFPEVYLQITGNHSSGLEENSATVNRTTTWSTLCNRPQPNPLVTSTKRRKQSARMMTEEESWYWRRSTSRRHSARNHVSNGEMTVADSEEGEPKTSDNGGGVSTERKDLFSKAEKAESSDVLIREAVSCQQSEGVDSEELNLKTAEIDNKSELEQNCLGTASSPICID